MLTSVATFALCWLSTFQYATSVAVGDVGVRTGDVDPQVAKEVGRVLLEAREKEKVYTLKKTKISKSWKDADLFSFDLSKYNYIDITCKHCYFKTDVSGHLKFSEDVDLKKVVDDIGDEMKNTTETAWHQIKDYVEDVAKDVWHFNIHDIPAWPTIDADFQLENTHDIPPMEARFEFDNLDLYVDMEIELEADTNYYLPLFTSETPAGFAVPGMEVGAIIMASLTIITDSYIDVRSGFHLKLKDTLALDMELFSKKVSRIKLPPSAFEVLPTSGNGEASVEVILELSADIGFDLYAYKLGGILSASAGIQASAYADLADIYLDLKANPKHKKCPLAAHAEYTMAVGADAGATIAVEDDQWGPYAATSTVLFKTVLPTFCAGAKKPAKTESTVTLTKTMYTTVAPKAETAHTALKGDMVTTTVSTTKSYTMVNCMSPSMIHCPNSLQNTTSHKRTMTTVLTVPSGETASYPADTFATVTDTMPFGTNQVSMAGITGVPKAFPTQA